GILVAVFAYWMHRSYLLLQVLNLLYFVPPWSNAFFRWLVFYDLGLVAVFIIGLAWLFLREPRALTAALVTVASLYATVLVVSVGGTYASGYFIFAVSSYVALFIL